MTASTLLKETEAQYLRYPSAPHLKKGEAGVGLKVRKAFMNNISALKKYYLFPLTSVMVICLCATFARAGNDFQEQYKAYQAEVNAGRAALD